MSWIVAPSIASRKNKYLHLNNENLCEYTSARTCGYEVLTGACIPYFDFDNSYGSSEEQTKLETADFISARAAVIGAFPSAECISFASNGYDPVKKMWKNSFHFLIRKAGFYSSGSMIPLVAGCDEAVYKEVGKEQKFRMAFMSKEHNNRPKLRCELIGDKLVKYAAGELEEDQSLYIIQNTGNETLIEVEDYSNSEKVLKKEIYAEIREDQKCAKSEKLYYPSVTVEIVTRLSSMLSAGRINDRIQWLMYMRMLKNLIWQEKIDPIQIKSLAHVVSRRSEKYHEKEIDLYFSRRDRTNKDTKCLGFATLCYWAKTDSPSNWDELACKMKSIELSELEALVHDARVAPIKYQYADYIRFVDKEVSRPEIIKYIVDAVIPCIDKGNHKVFTRNFNQQATEFVLIDKKMTLFRKKSLNDVPIYVAGRKTSIYDVYNQIFHIISYRAVKFEPYLQVDPTDSQDFNIFGGFAYKFEQVTLIDPLIHSSLGLIFQHMFYILCMGDKIKFNFLMGCIAHVIQNPADKIGIALVLQSEQQGTGKNRFTDFLMQVFGIGLCSKASKIEDLVSTFNSHLMGKLLVIADEVANFAGYKVADQLKAAITEKWRSINGKGRDAFLLESCEWYILTSNSRISVRTDEGDRRYFVLEVSPQRKGDSEYFTNLSAVIDSPQCQQDFLNYMGSYDLSSWDRQKIPMTDAKRQLTIESFGAIFEFLLQYLENVGAGEHSISAAALYTKFAAWASESGLKSIPIRKLLIDKLKSYGVFYKKGSKKNDRSWKFFWTGSDLEKKFQSMLGNPDFKIDWNQEDEPEDESENEADAPIDPVFEVDKSLFNSDDDSDDEP